MRSLKAVITGLLVVASLGIGAVRADAYPYGGGKCRNTNNTWSYWYTNSNSDSTSVLQHNLTNGSYFTTNGTGVGYHSGLNSATVEPIYVVDNVTSQTATLTYLGRC